MRKTRQLVTILLVVFVTIGCKQKQQSAEETSHELSIRAESAGMQSFERRLTVQGTLETKNYANVAARAEGNLDAIWVDEGDKVVANQTVLFQIDPASRENALIIARQDLAVAKASLDVAKASLQKTRAEASKAALDYARYERLHRENRVTDNEFESAEVANAQATAGIAVSEAQVELAERHVKQAEAALAIAQKSLDDTQVLAPITGVVSSRSAEPGEHMSVGRVLLRIDDLTHVEAAAYIPAQYYPEVIPGETRFRLTVNGLDAGSHVINYRSPTINPLLRTFEIKGRVDANENLAVPGNMADLTIVFAAREALGVPTASVLIRNNNPTVFVIEGDRAIQRQVTTGLQTDGWTEILSGLEAGDLVATEGQTQLRDGAVVSVL